MSLALRIQDQFEASVLAIEEALPSLTEALEQAVQVMTEGLMAEGKILVCGQGAAGLVARHLATVLADRFERERPGLAALALAQDAASMHEDADARQGPARQVAALAHPDDVLLAVSTFGEGEGIRAAVQAAQERGLRVVCLCGGNGGRLAAMLTERDVLVCVPTLSAPRVLECQFLLAHCLCDGIDQFLLGA